MSTKIKRAARAVPCALLAFMTLFSGVITAAAWFDFSQSKSNIFTGTAAEAGVVLRKRELDAAGGRTDIPVRNAEFALYRIHADGTVAKIGGVYTTDSGGDITVERLSAGSYKFIETNPGYGYDYAPDGGGQPIRAYPFHITREDAEGYVLTEVEAWNVRRTGGLEILKTVVNADGSELSEEQRAAEFEFTVSFSCGGSYPYQIDGEGELKELDGGKLWLRHGETAVFSGVPVGAYYCVVETRAQGYITERRNSQGSIRRGDFSRAEFTNVYGEPADGEVEITVEKTVRGEIPESEYGRGFWFTFHKDGGAPLRFMLKSGEKKSFTLNAGDAYSVTEDDPFGYGYVQTTTAGGADGGLTLTFVNTYIGTVWRKISGEKHWKLGGAPESVKPGSVTVLLKNGGELVQSMTVKPDASGRWRYEFTVPKYDGGGNEIHYTVEEAPVAGFTSRVDGYDIINTRVPVDGTSTTAPSEPSLPSLPSEPSLPNNPSESSNTSNTSHPNDPSNTNEPSDPSDPIDPGEPAPHTGGSHKLAPLIVLFASLTALAAAGFGSRKCRKGAKRKSAPERRDSIDRK